MKKKKEYEMEMITEWFEGLMMIVVLGGVVVMLFRGAAGMNKHIEVTDRERMEYFSAWPEMFWSLPRKKDADE